MSEDAVGRYKPTRYWAVMGGDVLALMLYASREEARRAARTMLSLRNMRPEIYAAGKLRVVRVTVQVDA
jgi:hypothetical protein